MRWLGVGDRVGKRLLGATLACAVLAVAPASAATLTVDGDLSDWFVSIGDNNTSNFNNYPYNPSNPVPDSPAKQALRNSIGVVGWFIEDQDDNAGDGGFVGPNFGGQNYDAEGLFIAHQGNTLYIAIATGQRPDNGFQRYSPGDLRLTTPNGVMGIEIGGGPGGGAGGHLTEGDAGSTYTLSSNGFTTGHNPTDPLQTVGSIWKNVDWILDPIAPHSEVQMQINGASTKVGDADYIYTRNNTSSPNASAQHSVIEMALDVTNLLDEDGKGTIGVFWSPSCGNDLAVAFYLNANCENCVQIPEPQGQSLTFVAALAGLAFFRRRQIARMVKARAA